MVLDDFGNVFSDKTAWIQWYEYTGVLGGSLCFDYKYDFLHRFKKISIKSVFFKTLLFALVFLTIPLFISNSILSNFSEPQQGG